MTLAKAALLALAALATAGGAAADEAAAYKPLWCAAMLTLAADDYRGNELYRDHVQKVETYELAADLMAELGRRTLGAAGFTPEQISLQEAEATAAAKAQLRDGTGDPAFSWASCWLVVEVELAALRAARQAGVR
jgi:hypothetical protein